MTPRPLARIASLRSRLRARAHASPPTSFLGMVALVREDYWTHDSQLMRPGFQAMAIHRFGVWRRALPPLPRAILAPFYHAGYILARNVYGIELPDTTRVGRRLRFSHQSGIVIHPDSAIGDDCIIRQNVTIGSPNRQRSDAPVLGNRVEVGAGAAIIGRVTIGDGARIGPNAVVTMRVPAGALVANTSPRIIHMKPRASAASARPTPADLPAPEPVAPVL